MDAVDPHYQEVPSSHRPRDIVQRQVDGHSKVDGGFPEGQGHSHSRHEGQHGRDGPVEAVVIAGDQDKWKDNDGGQNKSNSCFPCVREHRQVASVHLN